MFPLLVARRYLFSKKKTNVINLISGVSVVGVAVATMALVVTLSVFNGFHDLVATLFTSFDPQLKITPVEGKTCAADDPLLDQIRSLDAVEVATNSLEDQALAFYHGRQSMVTIKGVDDNFDRLTHIREILWGDGTYELHAANLCYGILGVRVAEVLGTGIRFDDPIQIYAPRREGQLDMSTPDEGFVSDELYSPGVIFAVQQPKYDRSYIITGIGFARNLFSQPGMVSSLELRLKQGSDFEGVKKQIAAICQGRFRVEDRFEQQDDTFQIMKIEKLIAYVFLTFILIIACFNIIGSLSMLIIDKQDDTATLRNLGATRGQVRRIFLFEGWLIAAIGAVVGIALGLLLCWLQQQYGIVGLGRSAGAFIIDAYPVSVHPTDIVAIFLTVIATGWLSVWYTVRKI